MGGVILVPYLVLLLVMKLVVRWMSFFFFSFSVKYFIF